jgi:hypothetical protein
MGAVVGACIAKRLALEKRDAFAREAASRNGRRQAGQMRADRRDHGMSHTRGPALTLIYRRFGRGPDLCYPPRCGIASSLGG